MKVFTLTFGLFLGLALNQSPAGEVIFSDDFQALEKAWIVGGDRNLPPTTSAENGLELEVEKGKGTRRARVTYPALTGFKLTSGKHYKIQINNLSLQALSGQAVPVLQIGCTPNPNTGTNGLPTLTDALYFQQAGNRSGALILIQDGQSTVLQKIGAQRLASAYQSVTIELSANTWRLRLQPKGTNEMSWVGDFSPALAWDQDLSLQCQLQQGDAHGDASARLALSSLKIEAN